MKTHAFPSWVGKTVFNADLQNKTGRGRSRKELGSEAVGSQGDTEEVAFIWIWKVAGVCCRNGRRGTGFPFKGTELGKPTVPSGNEILMGMELERDTGVVRTEIEGGRGSD